MPRWRDIDSWEDFEGVSDKDFRKKPGDSLQMTGANNQDEFVDDDYYEDDFTDFDENEEREPTDNWTPYNLNPQQLLSGIRHFPNGVNLKLPDEKYWGEVSMNFGHEYVVPGMYAFLANEDEDDRYSTRRLRHKDVLRKNVDVDDGRRPATFKDKGDKLFINCRIKNKAALKRKEIPREFVNRSTEHKEDWPGDRYYKTSFYTHFIEPYTRGSKADNPFDWAYEKAQLAHGFVYAMGINRDFPPRVVEYPFKVLAGRMINSRREDLVATREVKMTNEKRAVLEKLEDTEPEVIWLAMENPEEFKDPEKLAHLKKMNDCLENGLIIDRLDQLVKKVGAKTALRFATAIYGKKKVKPWWFKDDLDMVAIVDWDNEKETALRVAGSSSFAFVYAMDLYREVGDDFCAIDGIGKREAMSFLTGITYQYGIGNTKRAVSIVKFAKELLADTPVSERSKALKSFKEYVARQKPISEIIGKMEGEDAIFNLPGVFGLLHGQLGEDRMREDTLDNITITAGHLREAAAPLSRPLYERARTEPAIKKRYDRNNLLAIAAQARPALTVGEDHKETEITKPLPGIFKFYELVREELGYLDENIAELYFIFFAPKMPNPFEPPKGFISLLKKLNDVRDPEYKFTFMEDPRYRHEVVENNAQLFTNRFLAAANLVDSWVMGIIDYKRLEEVLGYLIEIFAKIPASSRMITLPVRAILDSHGGDLAEVLMSPKLSIDGALKAAGEHMSLNRVHGYGQNDELERVTKIVSTLVGAVIAATEERKNPEPVETDLDRTGMEEYMTKIESIKDDFVGIVSRVRESILKFREDSEGLLPVGGKIHFLRPVDEKLFDMVMRNAGLGSTPFRLLAANTTMNLPPTPSAEELISIVNALQTIGLVDDDFPELQIGIGCRLPPEMVAILGSFILLATEKGIVYKKESFCTNRDHQTGARIMAYDDNQPNVNLPNTPGRLGRTDMLCRRHAGDIKIMQKLGTVLVHAHLKKGPFGVLAKEFTERYEDILKKYKLDWVLKESWIFKPGDAKNNDHENLKHFEAVNACVQAYLNPDEGNDIVSDVRELFDSIEADIRKIQTTLRGSDKACTEPKALIGLDL